MLIGIVGKPSVGKSQFLNAACMTKQEVSAVPFTTLKPKIGIGYVRVQCPCKEFGVKDNPKNSFCIDGTRFVPVKLMDTPGLVPGAHEGRGLGNQFLDELRQADCYIHIVDASGSTDEEGREVPPGTHDPLKDVKFLEDEISYWLRDILLRGWDSWVRKVRSIKMQSDNALYERLTGLKISKTHIKQAMRESDAPEALDKWNHRIVENFARVVWKLAKPMIIAANKIDKKYAEDNYLRLKEAGYTVVPMTALGEWHLKRLAEAGRIKYVAGDSDFKILSEFSERELFILERLRNLMHKYGGTGVQQVLETMTFDVMKMIVVFPVYDQSKLSDRHGNVLPDAYLLPEGATARDLARVIHTEIAEKFIGAIDVRTKRKLGDKTPLKHRDVIRILVRK